MKMITVSSELKQFEIAIVSQITHGMEPAGVGVETEEARADVRHAGGTRAHKWAFMRAKIYKVRVILARVISGTGTGSACQEKPGIIMIERGERGHLVAHPHFRESSRWRITIFSANGPEVVLLEERQTERYRLRPSG